MTHSAPSAELATAVGRELQQRREMAGISIEMLALRLKVSPSQLELVESGDWDRLPGPVFVRGTVRLLARELGEDPNEWLQRMSAWAPTVPQRLMPPSNAEGEVPLSQQRGGWRWIIVAVVIVALALGYIQWFWPATDWMEQEAVSSSLLLNSSSESPEETATAAHAPPGMVSSAAGNGQPVAQDSALSPAGEETRGKTAGLVTDSHSAPDPGTAAPPAAMSVVPAATESAATSTAPVHEAVTTKGLHLLAARGESWLRITDAQGKVVYEGILRQGNERHFPESAAPYALHVGAAQALDVRWNGALVETGKGVARLTVPAPARERAVVDPAPRSAASPEKPSEP